MDIPEIKELDFTYFHDLMHRPFSRYCWSLYGGPRRHIALWWEYKGWPNVRRLAFCPHGDHRWVTWTERATGKQFQACNDCCKEKE